MATTTTTNAPLPWMEPYLRDYASRAQDQANQPYKRSPGSYTGPNGLLTAGWQAAANRAQQGSPIMGEASGQLRKTIGGDYLGRQAAVNPYESAENPYLSDTIKNAQGDLTTSYNQVQVPQWAKAMQTSGSFGNSGVSEYAAMDANNLQKNLGRISTDLRGQDFGRRAGFAESRVGRQDAIAGQERGLQHSAMGMAPSFANQDYTDIRELLNVGREAQGFDQQQQGQEQQWFQDEQQFPQNQLDSYGQSLGLGTKGGTSTQTQPDPSKASQWIGGGLTGLALYNMLMGKP